MFLEMPPRNEAETNRGGKVRESTITFCLTLIEWNFEEVGVGTGAKRSRRRVQMSKVIEKSRGGGGDGVEIEACSLIENSGSDRQLVKMSEYWSNVNIRMCTDTRRAALF